MFVHKEKVGMDPLPSDRIMLLIPKKHIGSFGIFLLSFFWIPTAQGQDTSRTDLDISGGLVLGAYFADGGTATFYNGKTEYGIERIFTVQQYRNKIEDELGSKKFWLGEYPEDMAYQAAFIAGLSGRYHVSERTSVFIEFQFIKLGLADQFTIIVDDPSAPNSERIETADISGSERRFLAPIGLKYDLGDGSTVPYLSFNGILGWVEAESNQIRIGSSEFNILPSDHPQYGSDIQQKGFIYGGGAELGLSLDLQENFNLEIGGALEYSHIPLGLNGDFALQKAIHFRVMYN